MGVRLLLNESEMILRENDRIYVAGIDDAHFYRVDDIAKAAAGIPHGEFAILLSHTPEAYRQAARAGFQLLLSGHTHGGQICLPGSIPITLDSHLPRKFGAGPWTFQHMVGYTSVGAGSCIVPVRLNCPPEITLQPFASLLTSDRLRHSAYRASLAPPTWPRVDHGKGLSAGSGSIGPIADMGFIEQPREKDFAEKENRNTDADDSGSTMRARRDTPGAETAIRGLGREKWRGCSAAALDEAREEIANHRHASDNKSYCPAKAKDDGCKRGQED
jgi:hypothetical protein